jgi:hypothetical protein
MWKRMKYKLTNYYIGTFIIWLRIKGRVDRHFFVAHSYLRNLKRLHSSSACSPYFKVKTLYSEIKYTPVEVIIPCFLLSSLGTIISTTTGGFLYFFLFRFYSTLLQLATLRFHCALKKNIKKTFLIEYTWKFRWGDCKVIYEEGLPYIWGNAQIFSHIWGGLWSYMTVQPLSSGSPYLWGKFCFIF